MDFECIIAGIHSGRLSAHALKRDKLLPLDFTSLIIFMQDLTLFSVASMSDDSVTQKQYHALILRQISSYWILLHFLKIVLIL